jgi:hypothetical protein
MLKRLEATNRPENRLIAMAQQLDLAWAQLQDWVAKLLSQQVRP